MSDTVEETPEVNYYPALSLPFDGTEMITVRVGSRLYLFEKDPETGECLYIRHAPSPGLSDEDEPKPFDPAEYR
jgi:hypothetical protein